MTRTACERKLSVARAVLQSPSMRLPHTVFAGLAMGLSLCWSAPATAEASTDKTQPAESAASRWYGDQLLMIDVGAIVVGSALYLTNPDGPMGTVGSIGGLGLYTLGGPIEHLAHDNPGRAGLSLLMRITLPAIGLLIGAQSSRHGDLVELEPILLGGSIGILTSVGVDAAIAWQDPPQQNGAQTEIARWSLSPSIGRRSGGISLGGAF